MIKRLSLVCMITAPLLLGGCSLLPVSYQMASMALDGISLLTTRKSLIDHGLSAVSQKDCELWRGITEGQLCRDIIDQSPEIITAKATFPQPDDLPAISSLYLSVI